MAELKTPEDRRIRDFLDGYLDFAAKGNGPWKLAAWVAENLKEFGIPRDVAYAAAAELHNVASKYIDTPDRFFEEGAGIIKSALKGALEVKTFVETPEATPPKPGAIKKAVPAELPKPSVDMAPTMIFERPDIFSPRTETRKALLPGKTGIMAKVFPPKPYALTYKTEKLQEIMKRVRRRKTKPGEANKQIRDMLNKREITAVQAQAALDETAQYAARTMPPEEKILKEIEEIQRPQEPGIDVQEILINLRSGGISPEKAMEHLKYAESTGRISYEQARAAAEEIARFPTTGRRVKTKISGPEPSRLGRLPFGAVEALLANMGLIPSESISPDEDILGKKIRITPVRIGMPGSMEEGEVLGPPKKDTTYPIDSIKIINDKGTYYVEFLSSKSGSKPITYKRIDAGPSDQMNRNLPILRPRYTVATIEEQKFFPRTQQPYGLLATPQEQKFLPRYEPQKALPRRPKALPRPKEQNMLLRTPQPFAYLPRPKLVLDSEPMKGVTIDVDGKRYATMHGMEISTGQHTLAIVSPYIVDLNGERYLFAHWEDNSTGHTRAINVGGPMHVVAHFMKVTMSPPPPTPPTPPPTLPPESPRRPPPPTQQKYDVTIDSAPMRGVQLNIFKMEQQNPITLLELEAKIGPRTAAAVHAIITNFDAIKGQFGKDRDTAQKWLEDQLKIIGFREYQAMSIAHFILERHFDEMRTALQQIRPPTFMVRKLPGYTSVSLKDNFETLVYLELPGGPDPRTATYVIAAPPSHAYNGEEYKFMRWEVRRESLQAPLEFDKPELTLWVTERIVAIAHYYKTVTHTDRPTVRSSYQRGVGAGGYTSSMRDTATGLLRTSLFKERRPFSPFGGVSTAKISENPALNASINKGKRMLNTYARAEYSRLFDPLRDKYQRRSRELRQLRNDALRANVQLRRIIFQQTHGVRKLAGTANLTNMDLINRADTLLSPGGTLAGNAALQAARDTVGRFIKEKDRYEEDFKKDLESASAGLRNYLKNQAVTISITIARRHKIPLNSDDETALAGELEKYAVELAEDFATRGRTMVFAMIRGLSNLSRGLQTFGGGFSNLLYNIPSLIFGPWTLGIALVIVQFLLVLNFVGPQQQIMFWMPLIAAIFTFVLNFANSARPLDWIVHLESGAIIGYSAALILIALGILTFPSAGFWALWAVLVFIGIFQLYQK